jgi:hypothetical protein
MFCEEIICFFQTHLHDSKFYMLVITSFSTSIFPQIYGILILVVVTN